MSGGSRSLSVLVMAAWLIFFTMVDASKNEPPKVKPTPARLKGMKAAVADLEKGVLKQKEYPPLPYQAAYLNFIRLLKSKCGVEWDVINSTSVSQELLDEVGGYNVVMRADVEHRFGREIFAKLRKKAGVVLPQEPNA